PRKAFLLHCTEERGTPHEYAGIVEERTKVNRTRYLAALQQTSTSVCSYSDGGISSGIDVLMEAHLTAADLEVYCDVLTRVSSARREDAVEYEPTIIVGTSGIEKEHLVNRAPVIAEVDLGQKRGAVAEHPCRHDWVLLIGG